MSQRLTKTYIRQNNISDYLDRIPYPMSLTDVSVGAAGAS